jgi:hypothetical protein
MFLNWKNDVCKIQLKLAAHVQNHHLKSKLWQYIWKQLDYTSLHVHFFKNFIVNFAKKSYVLYTISSFYFQLFFRLNL